MRWLQGGFKKKSQASTERPHKPERRTKDGLKGQTSQIVSIAPMLHCVYPIVDSVKRKP